MVSGRYRLAVSHGYGGGSEAYLRDEFLSSEAPLGHATIVATPHGRFVRLVAQGSKGSRSGLVSHHWLIHRLLTQPPSAVVLNGLPGWNPVRDLLGALALLPPETQLTIPIHDYHVVCPSFNLVNAAGIYCGIPTLKVCQPCFPIIAGAHASEFRDVAAWREAWAPVLRRANVVAAFSGSSAALLQRAYPFAKPRVEPHRLRRIPRMPTHSLERSSMPRIAVFGDITPNKGAQMLIATACLAARRGYFIEWHVFGSFRSPGAVPSMKVHGAYSTEQMPAILEEHGISAAVLPSVVPESFSYVAEELASMAVPFAAFPLGAPHERFRGNDRVFFAREIAPEALLVATLDAIEAGWERFAPGSSPLPESPQTAMSAGQGAPE
jgi:hypothetical protein